MNPVCAWTRLEAATWADGEPRSGDVVFLAIDTQIRSLWLTCKQYRAVQYLVSHNPTTQAAWTAWNSHLNADGHAALCHELVTGGLVALR
jgi:hypothetical protein